jgi:DNA-binding NtrC family response regulator
LSALGPAGRSIRLLIVDDDPALGRALVRMLRPANVVLVASAAEAVDALSRGEFDAILTDYGLEPMNGVALLSEVARAHPTSRRYLMSGFDAGRFSEHIASGLIRRMFPKPLDIAALRAEMGCIPRP